MHLKNMNKNLTTTLHIHLKIRHTSKIYKKNMLFKNSVCNPTNKNHINKF